MTMKCADARHLIHLDSGSDLNVPEEHDLAVHMEQCSECRSYHQGMSAAMSALHVLRDFDGAATASSARSGQRPVAALLARLPARSVTSAAYRKFNGRVAALAVCSLALAVVTIVQALPSARVSTQSHMLAGSRVAMYGSGVAGMPPNSDSSGDRLVPVFNSDGSTAGYIRVGRSGLPSSLQSMAVESEGADQTF